MKNPIPRLARYMVLALALVAVSGTGCSSCRKKRGATAASALAEIPANSLGAVYINMARVRAHPSFVRARQQINSNPQLSLGYTMLRSMCGWDPLDKVDAIIGSITSTQPLGQDYAVVVHTSTTQQETTQCLTNLFTTMAHQPLTQSGTVNSHPVYTIPGTGSHPVQVAILEHGLAVAPVTSMPGLLNLVDHPPRANANTQLTQAADAAGANSAFVMLADLVGIKAAIPAGQQPNFNQASGIPGISSAMMQSLYNSAQNSGFGAAFTSNGVHLDASVRFAQAADAHTASALATTAWALARAQIAQFSPSQFSQMGLDPATTASATQAYTSAVALANRVQIRDEGPVLRITLDATQAELDNISNGIQSGMRAFTSLFAGRAAAGGGGSLTIPGTTGGTLDSSSTPVQDGAVGQDYSVYLTAGSPVTIVVRGGPSTSSPGENLDVYTILMRNGAEVTHDDDSAGNFNSRIIYTPLESGMYTVRVTTYGSGLKTGSFTVQTLDGAHPEAS